ITLEQSDVKIDSTPHTTFEADLSDSVIVEAVKEEATNKSGNTFEKPVVFANPIEERQTEDQDDAPKATIVQKPTTTNLLTKHVTTKNINKDQEAFKEAIKSSPIEKPIYLQNSAVAEKTVPAIIEVSQKSENVSVLEAGQEETSTNKTQETPAAPLYIEKPIVTAEL